tara:strand:+ start:281 stop:559 length:279 start_codon:yes stop_codon:yes gene_type:complete
MKFLKFFFLIIGCYFILNYSSKKSYADIDTNSIINMFCLENVKQEMLKANLKYNDSFGIEVCNCYIKNISNNKSHERAILDCKLESKNNLSL